LAYGDKDILAGQFESMEKWVKFSRVSERNHFGDWLALDRQDENGDWHSDTRKEFVRCAYNAYSTSILIKAGKILGREVSAYEKLYADILDEFNRDFSEPRTQTEYVLALHFNLTNHKREYAAALAKMIEDNGCKLATGFVGAGYLLHALSDNGYTKLAYTLLLRTEFPSWLYPVTKGATTIWERWNGIKPDGSLERKEMNSFNHYAYGAAADWLYEKAAGIRLDENAPAFENIIIQPHPDRRLRFFEASVETKYGMVRLCWKVSGDKFEYEINLPSKADITIGGQTRRVSAGVYIFNEKIE
jgi:alpha-L-rhamnosidase